MKAILLLACFMSLCGKQALATEENFGYEIAYDNGKAGIQFKNNESGLTTWVLPAEYDSISRVVKYMPLLDNSTIRIYNLGNSSPLYPGKGYYFLYKNGKMGLFAVAGLASDKIILSCKYDLIIYKKEHGSVLLKENNKWGLYSLYHLLGVVNGPDGSWVLSTDWDELDLFDDNNLAFVTKNNKAGLFETVHNSWALEVRYDNITWRSKEYHNDIMLVSDQGKTGAFSYNYHAKQRGRWIIPIDQYDNISHTEPRSDFLIVDSAGRLGVWQFVSWSKNNDDQRAWPITEASYSNMTYDGTRQLLEVKKDNAIGILSGSGWVVHPVLDKNSTGKDYFLFGTKVRVQYKRGSGFEVKCISTPSISSIQVPDTISYDDFRLNGNILTAVKDKKTTAYLLLYKMQDDYWGIGERQWDRLNLVRSMLLVSDAEVLYTYPREVRDDEWVKNKSIIYYKKGEMGSWKLEEVPFKEVEIHPRQGKIIPVDNWDPHFAKEKSKQQWNMLLVSQKTKWGVVDPEGNILAPFDHGSYKLLNDGLLLLQSPVKGSWRLFSTPARGIRSFLHNDVERIDFSSRRIVDNSEVLIIDNKPFYIHEGTTSSPLVQWFTSTSKVKPVIKPIEASPVGGQVLLEIPLSGLTVRKMPTGVGVYKLNEEIIPPYLDDIYLDRDREGFPPYAIVLVLKDKNVKGQFLINLNDVAGEFNPGDFIAIGYMNACELCSGSGGKMGTITNRVEASTRSTLTQKVEYKEGYQPVWDARTNSYVGTKTFTPVTTYEATTSKVPGSTTTTRAFISCSKCNGRGIMWNVKRHCSIGVNGLEPGKIISELKR